MTSQQRESTAYAGTLGTQMSRRAFGAGTVGVGLALATSGRVAAQEPAPGGELRLTLGESANINLNPIGITTLDSFFLASCIYNGLVTSSATWDEAEPALAESWDVSDDGLLYTFHLREGVPWHDGEPFTAADVEFTYHTILNPDIGSYMAGNLSIIKGAEAYMEGTADAVEGIRVLGDLEIEFELSEPNAAFLLSVLTQHSIIPRHVWQDVSAEEMVKPGTWEQGQIGTGPFQFSVYEPDRFLELVRFDDGWRGAPLLDKVIFVHVGTTPEATAAALENGDIDYAVLPANEFERMRELPQLTVDVKPVHNIRSLSVNVDKPYLSDPRVRQAIAYGINRAGINESIMAPAAASINTVSTSEKWQNTSVPDYAFDPDRARDLLAEAGWDPEQSIELALYYQDQPHKDAIAFMQQQLGEIGINAEVVQVEPASILAYYYEDRDFDVMLVGLGTSPDFSSFETIFACDATWPTGQNAMLYCNERVDELFEQGRINVDEAERKAAYDEIQDILVEELPWIPFYQLQLIGGFTTRVHDADAIFFNWNRPYNWSIEKVWISED